MKIQISQLKKLIELAEKTECKYIETLYHHGKLDFELNINPNNNVVVTFHDDQPELTEIVQVKRGKI